MEIKNKVKDSFLLLELNKKEIMDITTEWIYFLNLSKENSIFNDIELLFNNILIKLKNIETALKDDLYSNEDTFLDFFQAGVVGGTECFEEINKLFMYILENEKEHKNEKDEVNEFKNSNNKEDKQLEELFLFQDELYFLKFKSAVFNFYNNMAEILDVVFNYADELYIHYGGDINLVKASKF